MNDLLLRALKCETVPRPPIWLHRQAGRFLPQYRATARSILFGILLGLPSSLLKSLKLPIHLLGFDAAILFSDIFVIAEVFGFSI